MNIKGAIVIIRNINNRLISDTDKIEAIKVISENKEDPTITITGHEFYNAALNWLIEKIEQKENSNIYNNSAETKVNLEFEAEHPNESISYTCDYGIKRLESIYNRLDKIENTFYKECDTIKEFLNSLTSCNNCTNKNCEYMPKWGEKVRYNCPFWKE